MSQSEDGKMKKQEDRLKVRDLIRQLEDGWRLARTRGTASLDTQASPARSRSPANQASTFLSEL